MIINYVVINNPIIIEWCESFVVGRDCILRISKIYYQKIKPRKRSILVLKPVTMIRSLVGSVAINKKFHNPFPISILYYIVNFSLNLLVLQFLYLTMNVSIFT